MNQELQEYIKKAKEAGKSDEEIKKELLSAGWREADINNTFQEPLYKLEENFYKQKLIKNILLTLGGFFIIISGYIFVVLYSVSNKSFFVMLSVITLPALMILVGIVLFIRGLKIHPDYKKIVERKMALSKLRYKLQKPEITNIREYLNSFASVKFALTQSGFWRMFAGIIFFLFFGLIFLGYGILSDFAIDILLVGILIIMLPSIYYFGQLKERINAKFWKGISDANGWQYIPYGDAQQEQATMFLRRGMTHRILNIIRGTVGEVSFRIFLYESKLSWLVIQPMRQFRPPISFYTVIAINLKKSIPHIYLNNRHDDLVLQNFPKDAIKSIPILREFERDFTLLLMTAASYENEEKLSRIFTSEILNFLLNSTFRYDDIEFANQEMLIYSRGRINNFQDFEKKFNDALVLKNFLEEKLKMM